MNDAEYEEIPEDYEEVPEATAAPAAPARAPSSAPASMGAAVKRGVLQGASFNFADEIAAAVDTGLSKVPGVRTVLGALDRALGGSSGAGLPIDDPTLTYQQRRDAYRGADAVAQAEHPRSFAAGEIGGALGTAAVPGAGAARAGGLAGVAKAGAKGGALAGYGASDRPDSVGQALDASIGALAGAAGGTLLHGAAKALAPGALARAGAAAEERGVERAIDKLGAGAYKRSRAGVNTDAVEELVRETPAIRKAAGKDAAVTETIGRARKEAQAMLDEVYRAASPEVSPANAVANMDAKIAELAKGTSEQREVGRALKAIRDEFQAAHGEKNAITPRELRAEQTAYQKKGYGKAMPGDDAATARIAANREASKAVGDAVVRHITGMDFAEASKVAALDPAGTAAKLLKANKQLSAIHKIEAAVADRAGKAQPKPGLIGKVDKAVKHPIETTLSLVPRALEAADDALARASPRSRPLAPGADEALARFVAAAKGGNPFAQRMIEAVASTPLGAARVAAAVGAEAAP